MRVQVLANGVRVIEEEGQPQPELQRRTEGIRLHSETKAWNGGTQQPVASMRHRASRQQILSTDTASLLERVMDGLVLLVGQFALHMSRGEQPLQIFGMVGVGSGLVGSQELLKVEGHEPVEVFLEESSDQLSRQHTGPDVSCASHHFRASHSKPSKAGGQRGVFPSVLI